MARRPALTAPRIDPIALPPLMDGDADELRAHATFDARRFADVDVEARDLIEVSFTECALTDVAANDADLRAARFIETTLDRLTAPVFRAARSHFRDVRISGSRLGSAELYESGWQSVHLIGCKLGYLNLRGAELRDVMFTDCTIDELDLGRARATRVSFPGSQVRSLDLTGATLTHVDLRSLDLQQLTGLEGLRGATLDSGQVAMLATLFAERLGIDVRD
jgi:uncharacterized protein YjbI with pentapeptide repeats